MWPRLDSIRVAAADRCVAMTTLPPPVIQLPPRTPLSRPPPPPRPLPRPPTCRPSSGCRHIATSHQPTLPTWPGGGEGWVPTHCAVCYRHRDPPPTWWLGSAWISRDIEMVVLSNRRLPETPGVHCPRSSPSSFLPFPPRMESHPTSDRFEIISLRRATRRHASPRTWILLGPLEDELETGVASEHHATLRVTRMDRE